MVKKPAKRSPRTNMDRVRQVAAGLGKSGPFMKIKEGKNKMRILPWSDDGVFFYKAIQHYGFTDGEMRRAYPCMRALGKASCPACQAIGANEDDTSPEAQKACKDLRPRVQYMMNVVDRETGEVKIYGCPKGVFTEIMGYFDDEDYGDLTHETEGRDVTIEREGKGMTDTRYNVRVSPKMSPINLDDWDKQIHDLEKEAYRDIPDRKTYIRHLLDCFGDTLNIAIIFRDELKGKSRRDDDDDEEEEDEGEEKPARKKSAKTAAVKKAKPKVEEDDEEEEEEEDEQPAKPGKKAVQGKKGSKRDEEEDEDEEEELEDDEEDEEDD